MSQSMRHCNHQRSYTLLSAYCVHSCLLIHLAALSHSFQRYMLQGEELARGDQAVSDRIGIHTQLSDLFVHACFFILPDTTTRRKNQQCVRFAVPMSRHRWF